MKKKLTKVRFIDFIHKITGYSKASIKKYTHEDEGTITPSFTFDIGDLKYCSWVDKGHIYTQLFLNGSCQCAWYHDFYTFKYNWKLSEEN